MTDAIYRVWYGAFDQAAALQLATILLGLSLSLIALERLLRGRARYHGALARGEAVVPRRLRGPRALLATALPCLLLALVLVGPVIQLLAWAVESVGQGAAAGDLARDDIVRNRALGAHGAALLPERARVLTHCNAGALACVGYGTAVGVIRAAAEAGRRPTVWVDETRPVLQGARLTAWELQRLGIPFRLVPDAVAGSLFSSGDVDCVVVGADRIAANGDVANKIGTYTLAVLASHHGVPFYVAAPRSTFDPAPLDGASIVVERRPADEVTVVGGTRIAPDGVDVENRAFDVTPAALVTAYVTEDGVSATPPA
jgi:methylthioribose-1-phosphate isomerase